MNRFALVLLLWLSLAWAQAGQDPNGGRTVEIPIAGSSDDAEEFLTASQSDAARWPGGWTYTGSSDLELIVDPSHGAQIVGLRFTGLPIPPGSVIDEARVLFRADAGTDAPVELLVYAQRDPEPATFASDAEGVGSADLSARPRTATSVRWAPEGWQAGSSYRTPDLSAVLQEVIDLPGWQEGNPVALLVVAAGGGAGYRSAVSYDGAPTGAPVLELRFTPPGDSPDAVATSEEGQEAAGETAESEAPPAPEAEAGVAPAERTVGGSDESRETVAPRGGQDTGAHADSVGEPRRVRAELRPRRPRGLEGSVLLSDYGIGGMVVAVRLDNPRPDRSYPAQIGRGTCDSTEAPFAWLEPIPGRLALSTTIVDTAFDELIEGPYHVTVYLTADGMTVVAACADLGGR